MRRIALGLAGAAALVAAAGLTITLRAPVDGAAAGERLVAAIADSTGLDIAVNGDSVLSMFPRPSVRVRGVSVSRRGEPAFAVARELVGSFRILPLLAGRIEIGDLTLDQPEIAADKLPVADALAAMRRAAPSASAPAIHITDGRIGWQGQLVDDVEAGLVWPSDGGSLTFSGYGRFSGRPIEATAQLSDLAALAASGRAPFRARLEGGGARLMFDGEASEREGFRLTGEISARAASLGDTLGWLGLRDRGVAGPPWAVSLAGEGLLDATGFSIANAELDLSGESMLGAGRLTFSPGGQAALEATLDAETLDLNPYLSELTPEIVQADGAWSQAAIDLSSLAGWSLDLRLSAGRARLGRLDLGATAATVAIAKGGLDLSIGEAAGYGGTVSGRLVLEPDATGARMRLEGAATDVALHEALGDMLARAPIAGALTADYALDSAGASLADIVAGLNGRANARLVDGAIESAAKSRTLALAGIRGRIAFSAAQARIAIERGVARSDEISVTGPDAAFALSGAASLVDRTIALKGSVRPAGRGWTLPVVIEGPLSGPKLRPDLGARVPRGEALRETEPSPVR